MAMHAPDAVAAPPLATAPAVPLSLADRLLMLRDRLYASRAFHRFASTYAPWRWITRVRSRQVFDLVGGFVYTQVITTCFAVDLFRLLDGGPQDEATIARHTGLGDEGTRRLLRAAASLRLVSTRSRGRWGLGPLGGPLVHDRALARMVAHNQHFYRDLADPSAILRKARGETELSRFWSYGAAERPHEIDPLTAAEFSGIMADTIPPLAEDVLDHYDMGRHRVLMDVGGGEGLFLAAAARRHPTLRVQLFDLPAVVARAQARFEREGRADRAQVHGGDFHRDALPTGADVITLVRVLLDHGDDRAQALVRAAKAALPPGGALLVAEPFAGQRNTGPLADAYFGLYLWAMGQGRARTEAEHRGMLEAAGFTRIRRLPTRTPLWTDLLVAYNDD
ncbi:MAG: methyltransferase [Gemmatimonadota bacterium]